MINKTGNMFAVNMFKVGDREIPQYQLACVPDWFNNVKDNIYTGDSATALEIIKKYEFDLNRLWNEYIDEECSLQDEKELRIRWLKWLAAFRLVKKEEVVLWKTPILGNSPINEIIKNTKTTMIDLQNTSSSRFIDDTLYFCSVFNTYDEFADTYLAPFLLSDRFTNQSITPQLIKTLTSSEYFTVRNQKPITLNNMFWLSYDTVKKIQNLPKLDRAKNLLERYVGPYLNELDLSKSYITGSAIPASLLEALPENFQAKYHYKLNDMQDILYPKLYSDFENLTNLKRAQDPQSRFSGLTILSDKSGDVGVSLDHFHTELYHFKIRPGADVDIAIDENLSAEEYEDEVLKHYAVIKKYYPTAQLEKLYKSTGGINYSIFVEDRETLPNFRTVELYQSSPAGIAQHHVPCVRGCYTLNGKDKPDFYFTASAVDTYLGNPAETFYFFVSNKSTPEDILLKYQKRGFKFSEKFQPLLTEYEKTHSQPFSIWAKKIQDMHN